MLKLKDIEINNSVFETEPKIIDTIHSNELDVTFLLNCFTKSFTKEDEEKTLFELGMIVDTELTKRSNDPEYNYDPSNLKEKKQFISEYLKNRTGNLEFISCYKDKCKHLVAKLKKFDCIENYTKIEITSICVQDLYESFNFLYGITVYFEEDGLVENKSFLIECYPYDDVEYLDRIIGDVYLISDKIKDHIAIINQISYSPETNKVSLIINTQYLLIARIDNERPIRFDIEYLENILGCYSKSRNLKSTISDKGDRCILNYKEHNNNHVKILYYHKRKKQWITEKESCFDGNILFSYINQDGTLCYFGVQYQQFNSVIFLKREDKKKLWEYYEVFLDIKNLALLQNSKIEKYIIPRIFNNLNKDDRFNLCMIGNDVDATDNKYTILIDKSFVLKLMKFEDKGFKLFKQEISTDNKISEFCL